MSIDTTNPVVQNALKARNAEPYDGMVIDAYKKSFADGAKKVLEGIAEIKVSKGRAITHFDELKKRDKPFADAIVNLIAVEQDVKLILGKL